MSLVGVNPAAVQLSTSLLHVKVMWGRMMVEPFGWSTPTEQLLALGWREEQTLERETTSLKEGKAGMHVLALPVEKTVALDKLSISYSETCLQ